MKTPKTKASYRSCCGGYDDGGGGGDDGFDADDGVEPSMMTAQGGVEPYQHSHGGKKNN